MNRFFSLIVILSLLISCGKQANQSTNPENPDNNKELKMITEGQQTVNYGSKSSLVDVSNIEELNRLWKEMTANKNRFSLFRFFQRKRKI